MTPRKPKAGWEAIEREYRAAAEMVRTEHSLLCGVQWSKHQISVAPGGRPIAVSRIKTRWEI